MVGEPTMTEEQVNRFWQKVEKGETDYQCWTWTAAKRDGYGRVGINNRVYQAHRISYGLVVGPIPDGLHLDHLCRNPSCVNPLHLEPVTQRINTLRGVAPTAHNARKTHCKHGHEFTEENTYLSPMGRHCKTCRLATKRRHYANPEKRARFLARLSQRRKESRRDNVAA